MLPSLLPHRYLWSHLYLQGQYFHLEVAFHKSVKFMLTLLLSHSAEMNGVEAGESSCLKPIIPVWQESFLPFFKLWPIASWWFSDTSAQNLCKTVLTQMQGSGGLPSETSGQFRGTRILTGLLLRSNLSFLACWKAREHSHSSVGDHS